MCSWVLFIVARLVGDLIYLDVVTLEGNKFCITGTTKLFYVNSSIGNTLDPRPSKANSEATTLVGLLQKISSKFKKGNIIRFKRLSALDFIKIEKLIILFLSKFWSFSWNFGAEGFCTSFWKRSIFVATKLMAWIISCSWLAQLHCVVSLILLLIHLFFYGIFLSGWSCMVFNMKFEVISLLCDTFLWILEFVILNCTSWHLNWLSFMFHCLQIRYHQWAYMLTNFSGCFFLIRNWVLLLLKKVQRQTRSPLIVAKNSYGTAENLQ